MDCIHIFNNVRAILAVFVAFEVFSDEDKNPGRGKTRQWIRRREERGYFNNIVKELSIEDTAEYKEMMRMSYADFQRILSYIEEDITRKQVLGGNKVIPPKERLALTIRFLATGETYKSLSYQFRISTRAISYIIKEVCKAIVENMRNIYLKVPSSNEEWRIIAEKVERRWQFPNCIGAIDGKHIVMQPPGNSGSYCYNYKHTNFIVLMAVAGPNYECLYYDIGTNGRVNDGGVWNKCGLSRALEEGKMNLPPPCCLPGGNEEVPFVLVGDDAFALKPYLMKPYAQQGLDAEKRVYNYRHS